MEKVVYILGAGFSVPFGLPLVNNFIEKSKDLFATSSEEFGYFEEIFKLQDSLSKIKNCYRSNLYNFEEVLSLLEMQNYFSGNDLPENYTRYISDVIRSYTPKFSMRTETGNSPDSQLLNLVESDLPSDFLRGLILFTASLCNRSLGAYRPDRSYSVRTFTRLINRNYDYKVISLNYDRLLEQALATLKELDFQACQGFSHEVDDSTDIENLSLVKIHGCVQKGNIIPPTWKKGSGSDVSRLWNTAYKMLSETNHIRVIGFSLPETDSYFKYLLKTSFLNSTNLKSFDVLCYDPDRSVEQRYREFITFPNLRFANEKTESYLGHTFDIEGCNYNNQGASKLRYDLETNHNSVFK